MSSSAAIPRERLLAPPCLHDSQDIAIGGTVTSSVLLPSAALAHATSRLSALEEIFKSAAPKDPGFTIQSGFVQYSSYSDLESIKKSQTIFLITSAPLSKFSRRTIAKIRTLMEPYPLVLESEKDTVLKLADYDSWPRLTRGSSKEEVRHGDDNNFTEEDHDRGNVDTENVVAFESETSVNNDESQLFQKVTMKGAISFKEDLDFPNTTTITVRHFDTSSEICKPALPGVGTYGLVHVLIGMNIGTGYFSHYSSPGMHFNHLFSETYRPPYLLRLKGFFCGRLRGMTTAQTQNGWLHSVWLQRRLPDLPHLLWIYPIMDDALRERFSLPYPASSVYQGTPSTVISYAVNDLKGQPPLETFSCEMISLLALPTPLVRNQETPRPIHTYRNFAISTIISLPGPLGSISASIQREASSRQYKDPSQGNKRAPLTITANVPDCVRYCERVDESQRQHEKMKRRHYLPLQEKD